MGHQHEDHTRGNIRIQSIAVAVGVLLFAIKFAAWIVTDSNAILSDTFESVINVLAGVLALYSVYYASRPRDAEHLYGHGKMEFISSGIEGVLIIGAGLAILAKAIYNLIEPQEIQELGLGIVLTSAAGLVNFVLALLLIKQGKKSHSTALEADGKHLLSDAYSTVGMLLGLVIIWITGEVWLDNVIALIFGLILIRIGYKVIRSAMAGILDETDHQLVQQIIEALEKHRQPDWIDVHNLRIIKFGSELHIDCHVTLPWYYSVEQGHDIVELIEKIVNRETQRQVEFFIHVDPCRSHSCSICSKQDCEVRKHPFEKKLKWTLEKVVGEDRHNPPKSGGEV